MASAADSPLSSGFHTLPPHATLRDAFQPGRSFGFLQYAPGVPPGIGECCAPCHGARARIWPQVWMQVQGTGAAFAWCVAHATQLRRVSTCSAQLCYVPILAPLTVVFTPKALPFQSPLASLQMLATPEAPSCCPWLNPAPPGSRPLAWGWGSWHVNDLWAFGCACGSCMSARRVAGEVAPGGPAGLSHAGEHDGSGVGGEPGPERDALPPRRPPPPPPPAARPPLP